MEIKIKLKKENLKNKKNIKRLNRYNLKVNLH